MAKRKKRPVSERQRQIIAAFLFIVSLLILIALVTHSSLDDARITGDVDGHLDPFEMHYRNQGGMSGAYLAYLSVVLLGWLAYFVPGFLAIGALRLFSSELGKRLQPAGLLLFAAAISGTVAYNVHLLAIPTVGYETGAIGGYLVTHLTLLSIKLVGQLGTYVVSGGLILILLLTFTSVTSLMSVRLRFPGGDFIRRLTAWSGEKIRSLASLKWLWSPSSDEDYPDEDDDEDESGEPTLPSETEDLAPPTDIESAPPDKESRRNRTTIKRWSEPVQVKSMDYTYPQLDLLDQADHNAPNVSSDELQMTARMLKETLETFQVTVDGSITSFPGPVITRFEFKPATGVKVNRIVALSDDLALALKAKRIRIVAPIPGKAAVGIEIPNRHPQTVFLRDILGSDQFRTSQYQLPLALGKTIGGKPFVTDLAQMPHLLIAGATGAGKSVCINALISSLMFHLHPLHVRFIFIDPKMLELSIYSGIPHLGRPVVTSPRRAEKVLADIVVEMDKRYRRLAEASVRSITDYNSRQKNEEDKLPYIVVFVDELADLMMAATSTKVEMLITRLAQMARAVGIHLILATQRPSVDVITGLIKANFPARIAFQVASKVDSRTIIDANGAEKLLGNGDMLFLRPGSPEPDRIHGAFISSQETERLVEAIKSQGIEMMALDTISQATGETTETEIDLGDPLFKEACEVVIRHKQGSVSLLQRRLGIGYQRAARLIDKLEQAGVVSAFDGSKAREVMVDKTYLETMFAGAVSSAPKEAG